MSVQRRTFVVGLRPEKREEYLRLHREVWPEVEAILVRHHLTNYSIFLHGDVLFAYYEYAGEDHDADMAGIAADPVSHEWWELTDPCQLPFDDVADGAIWSEAREVWHLSE